MGSVTATHRSTSNKVEDWCNNKYRVKDDKAVVYFYEVQARIGRGPHIMIVISSRGWVECLVFSQRLLSLLKT